jgi:putative DNA primase/helicase
MQNKIEKFKYAMLNAGINPPDEIIPDGKLHRFKIDGKLNGWYTLHLDGKSNGCFGDWKQGINEKWKLAEFTQKFTAKQKAEFKKQRQISEATQKAELEAQYKAAAEEARYIYANAQPVTNHPYLTRKNIKANGARMSNDGRLVIPLFDENMTIVNVQFIAADGTKRFLKGGRKKGCFFAIGVKSEKICIAEGFATAASIYEHTKQQTFVAFDAGNLEPVAKAIRWRNPHDEIVIMAY